jgi:hypothetical protein
MSDTIISVNNDAVENTHEKGTLMWDLPILVSFKERPTKYRTVPIPMRTIPN